MLREKFPEFCGSPSPPVGGAGPPTPSPASKGRATRAQAGRGVLLPLPSAPRRGPVLLCPPSLRSFVSSALPVHPLGPTPLAPLLPPLPGPRLACPQQGGAFAGRVHVTSTLPVLLPVPGLVKSCCPVSRAAPSAGHSLAVGPDGPARFSVEAHSALASALAAPQPSGGSRGLCCFVPAESPREGNQEGRAWSLQGPRCTRAMAPYLSLVLQSSLSTGHVRGHGRPSDVLSLFAPKSKSRSQFPWRWTTTCQTRMRVAMTTQRRPSVTTRRISTAKVRLAAGAVRGAPARVPLAGAACRWPSHPHLRVGFTHRGAGCRALHWAPEQGGGVAPASSPRPSVPVTGAGCSGAASVAVRAE